nr:MAG TPA: hypothetical protein [Caudoviricetes sp.]
MAATSARDCSGSHNIKEDRRNFQYGQESK